LQFAYIAGVFDFFVVLVARPIRIGKFISMTAVPMSVSVEWKKPYKDGIYLFADVSLSFNEVEKTSSYAMEVESA
jgi:hypothetical protein